MEQEYSNTIVNRNVTIVFNKIGNYLEKIN